MEKKRGVVVSLCIFIAVAFCSVSCDTGSSDDIPEEVLEAAGGVFEFGFLMIEDGPYPLGMSVTTDGNVDTMTLTSVDTGEGFTVSGTVILTTNNPDPLDIWIVANLSTAGSRVIICSMNGGAVWAAGTTYDTSPPQSVAGTFTYNGKTYNLTDILNQS